MVSGKMEGPSVPAVRRGPYEVLNVSRDSSDQEMKSEYRKLALKSLKKQWPSSSQWKLAMAKDPEASFFKRLEGLQPCDVSELKPGTHVFAVYGDNFFKTATYTVEALHAKSFEVVTQKLKEIEAQILVKRNDLRWFETEYRKALTSFQEVMNRYKLEKQSGQRLLLLYDCPNHHEL
ncbi:hypothetical protein Taro_035590 [Colocasia esculenta]|uniref:Uncharacterized protein n=1 Tax=Colocasia esculenta TaxID=4460 RepID=A0A843VUW4_COLES|nr:hypothetical protein [Colocasia esculenta]